MNRRFLTILIGSLLLSATATSPAAAQSPDRVESSYDSARIVDLKFLGGTAAEYVAALQKASPVVNIVVLNDISRVRMPPIVLKRVAINAAIGLLEDVPDNDLSPTVILSVNSLSGPGPQSNQVYTVRARARSSRAGQPLRTTVISVRDLIEEHVAAEDLLTAVETALQLLQKDYSAADVKFHEATGLLICRGHAEQTNAIEQVISQLEHDVAKRISVAQREEELERLTLRLHEFELERNELREVLSAAERRILEMETVLESKEHQIALHRQESTKLRARADELERELQKRSDGGR